MKPYPNYKPSGVDWLGDVPEHWEVVQLRRLVEKVKTGSTPSGIDHTYFDENGIHWFKPSDLSDFGELNNSEKPLSEEYRNELTIYPKNTVFCVGIGATIGKTGILSIPASCNQQINAVVFNKQTSAKFGMYYLSFLKDYIVKCGKYTTLPIINQDETKSLIFTYPPLQEQTAIANFLDRKTAEIDDLIARKRLLLEKLAEKRTALISHAVTRGLNADVPLKESGVAWLGEVPEHWEIKRLKFIASYNDEQLSEQTDPDVEIEYIDISSVNLVNGIETTECLKFENAPSRARRKVQDGDVIVSTVRTYLKAITQVKNPPENMIVSTGFAVIRPKKDFNPDFAGYFLQSSGFVNEVVARSVGVSYPAINASELVKIPTALPPLEEQTAIANYLDEQTALIDRQMQTIETAIEKLNEYRTALISQAVSGKIDVR